MDNNTALDYPIVTRSGVPLSPPTTVDTRSYQELLYVSKGRFLVCSFLIGAQTITTLSGFLVNVGPSYFVLRDPCTNIETTCDIYSLKFVAVYPAGEPDPRAYCVTRLYRNTLG